MSNSFTVFASFSWAVFGFLLLALTIDRHRLDVFGKSAGQLHKYYFPLLHGLGWAGLLLSLFGAVLYKGWAVGATAWVGILALAAFSLMLLFAYKPAWTVLSIAMSFLIGMTSIFGIMVG